MFKLLFKRQPAAVRNAEAIRNCKRVVARLHAIYVRDLHTMDQETMDLYNQAVNGYRARIVELGKEN